MSSTIPAASAPPKPRSPNWETERVRLLYRLSPRTLIINLLIGFLVAFLLRDSVKPLPLSLWLAALVLASAARAKLYLAYRRSPTAPANPLGWENAFAAGAGLMGLIWAGLPLIGPFPLESQLLILLVIGGLVIGAAGVLGASRRSFLAYACPMIAAQICELLRSSGSLLDGVAAIGGVFILALAASYTEFRRGVFSAIDAREACELRLAEEHQVQEQLLARQEQLDLVLGLSQTGIWDWNLATETTYFSARLKEILGCPASTELGKEYFTRAVVHREDRDRVLAAQERHLKENVPYDCEYRVFTPSGQYVWVRDRGKAIRDESGRTIRFVGSLIDITQRKSNMEHALEMAHQDVLTALPNRRLLDDRLSQALSVARRNKEKLAVMMVDLDNFKRINDSHGHDAGDLVLTKIAERLRKCLRASDTVARFGGDEFVVILEEQYRSDYLASLAEKMLTAMRDPILTPERQFVVTASIGIAVYPTDASEPESLLNAADKSMYRAKEAGGNSYRFPLQRIGRWGDKH